MPGRRPPERAEVTSSGIPAWLLVAYLVEPGGAEEDDDTVHGEGWTAQLVSGKRMIGRMAIGRVTVTIDGGAAKETRAVLRKKAQRGGG